MIPIHEGNLESQLLQLARSNCDVVCQKNGREAINDLWLKFLSTWNPFDNTALILIPPSTDHHHEVHSRRCRSLVRRPRGCLCSCRLWCSLSHHTASCVGRSRHLHVSKERRDICRSTNCTSSSLLRPTCSKLTSYSLLCS